MSRQDDGGGVQDDGGGLGDGLVISQVKVAIQNSFLYVFM